MHASKKESKEGCSLAAQGDWRPRRGSCCKIYKEGLKRQINAFEGNHPTSIVERPIGPVKVSFLTKLRKSCDEDAFFNQPTSRPATESYHVTLRESTRLACWHVRENRSMRWQDLPLDPYGSDGWSHYSFECLLRLALERGTSTAKVLKPANWLRKLKRINSHLTHSSDCASIIGYGNRDSSNFALRGGLVDYWIPNHRLYFLKWRHYSSPEW